MVAKPKRGDCWIIDLGMVAKVRPCLILSVPAAKGNDRMKIRLSLASLQSYENSQHSACSTS